MRIYVPTYTSTKQSSEKEESALYIGGEGYDEWEEPTKIILGLSGMHNCLPDESMHNVRCAWSHLTWEVVRKESRLAPLKDISHYCIRAHSWWEVAEARFEIRYVYSQRVLSRALQSLMSHDLYTFVRFLTSKFSWIVDPSSSGSFTWNTQCLMENQKI